MKIPATIVTGFLGAGKTSLVRHLLERADGRRLALIVNEFGDLGVDAEILKGCGVENCTEDDVLELAAALADWARPDRVVLVDCLTLWLANLMDAERDPEAEAERLVAVLAGLSGPALLVSNEVGLGIVPDNALARAFRDAQGRLNPRMAVRAERVVLMVAGLAMEVK